MRIECGQDALGKWAWMLFDKAGRMIASDDQYGDAALAMEDALNHKDMHERSERRKRQLRG